MRYFLAIVICIITVSAHAADRLVPSQYANIQAAVNAATAGDTIIVSPGDYRETVTVNKANLTFNSTTQYGAKVLGENSRVYGFVSGGNNTSGVTINGFEIFGQMVAGIHVRPDAGANGWTIKNNKIRHVRQFGVSIRSDSHIIEDNYIYFIGNAAEAYAVYLDGTNSTVRRNTIHTASKNLLRSKGGNTIQDNIMYHSDTCLAVNGGGGGESIYNNYIFDCLSAIKPKHTTCTSPRNNGFVRIWHNTVTMFNENALDIGENTPNTSCIDSKNNVFHRFETMGNSAIREDRNLTTVTFLNCDFFDVAGIPLYINDANSAAYTTLDQLRTNFGYEPQGIVGNSGLTRIQEGVFYTPGSPVFNGCHFFDLGGGYGDQMGARNLTLFSPKVVYINTLRAISASVQGGTISRLTDGRKVPAWQPNNTNGWIVLETNGGNPATFGYFSFLGIIPELGTIRTFLLYRGDSPNGPWTIILGDGGNTSSSANYNFFELGAPVTTRYLRLEYTSSFNNLPVEIGEIDIFNYVPQSAPPPPPPPPDPDDPPPPQVDHDPAPIYSGGEGAGTQRYISPGGTGTTCSLGTPCSWATAINASQPDDAIIFTDGPYPIQLTTVRSGLEGRHILIKALNTGQATVNGSFPDLVLINHSYITIRGLHFFDTKAGFPNATNTGGNLTLMRMSNSAGAHHIIIEDNEFEHCGNSCFTALGSTNISSHIIIRNNLFDGTGYTDDHTGRAIRIGSAASGAPGVENVSIYGNIIQDFTGAAIEVSVAGRKVWAWDNDIRGAATAASHGTSPEPDRSGLILNRGSQVYFYRNVVRDSAFGAKILTSRNSLISTPSLFYNNIITSVTGNNDVFFCEAGNVGPQSQFYNNTLWSLTDHTVGVVDCPLTVVNNIGINGVANNLATADYASNYFNDVVTRDFTLTVNAVNAIDDVTVAPFATTDKTGKGIFGAAKDYGAHEYGGFPPLPPPPGDFPTTIVLDDFNRANVNPIAGMTIGGVSTGMSWVNGATGTGTCQVIDNTMRRGTGTFDCYVGQQFGASQEVYVTLPNATNHGNLTNSRLRACLQSDVVGTTNANGYQLRIQKQDAAPDRLMIEILTTGSATTLGDFFEQEMVDGDKMGLEILEGGTLNAWVNIGGSGWELKFTRNNTTYDCANTYIGAAPHANALQWFDDYGGGTSVSSPPGNLLVPPIIFFKSD